MRPIVLAAILLLAALPPATAQTPAGELTVSFHVTLPPSWFAPSTAPPQLTPDDVKWSFERYQGAGAKEFRARMRQVEVVDPLVIRFHLKEPWPDFMTFYGTTATAAGIVLPRK